MKRMRKLIGAVLVLVGFVLAYRALREPDDGASLAPGRDLSPRFDNEEPVLGYDGMDLQTVVEWLESADLDSATLRRIRAYEQRNRSRESVLDTLNDLIAE
jgi:hypothetical protein